MKYIFASFGRAACEIAESSALLENSEFVLRDNGLSFFINQHYDTGIPNYLIWHEHLGILLHGIVFPKGTSLDDFAENPDPVLQSILSKHLDDPQNIPYEFSNGTYVGFVIDKKKHLIYAFTGFLNSIPLYYCRKGEILMVSTDLNRLAKICSKTVRNITQGLIEYYHLGTNLSDLTAIEGIYTVPKGAYLKFDGHELLTDYYYKFPSREVDWPFNKIVEEFHEVWERNLKALDSKKFRFGLGLTGGVDSRLILAGWSRKD